MGSTGLHSASAAAAAWAVAALAGCGAAPMGPPSPGPFLGHVTADSAAVWARVPGLDGPRAVHLAFDAGPGPGAGVGPGAAGSGGIHWLGAEADPQRGGCVVWRIEGLAPSTAYRYRVEAVPRARLDETGWSTFRTAPPEDRPARVTVAFGSCAREDDGTARTWERIDAAAPDALVLLGDTPYIDATALRVQRRRYVEFLAQPALARLAAHTPLYAVWDDHDFGADDTDGNLPGKDLARRAFIEHHANPSYGDGKQGVYTSFRRGPLEVFLLDTRSFANTGPSPADSRRPTLLGRQQWDWLTSHLAASTAPFKVLAGGMIWNGAVRLLKTDHWETWRHERDALFAVIGDLGIGGVVLVGGDIHRSRVIRHATSDLGGYDLLEFISSPLHGEVMAAAGVAHPGLIADMAEPHVILFLTADSTVTPARLEARFVSAAGATLFETVLTAEELH